MNNKMPIDINAIPKDEIPHASGHVRGISIDDIFKLSEEELMDSEEVVLHNTMRFDVCLAYIQPMLEDTEACKKEIIEAIRNAIVSAVNNTTGNSQKEEIYTVKRSIMLHRETIYFDFS